MRRVMVRYRVKPGQAERNEELVRAVYEELHRADPPGFSGGSVSFGTELALASRFAS